MAEASGLYPEIEPYDTGLMDTGDGHRIYWERSGNPQGTPAVFLHGGPGSGSSAYIRRLFNPRKYDIIQFDQRGSGKSKPHAALENNTTAHLVSDMEKLRMTLGVEKWIVAGGSWGATLALAYAQAHADRIAAMTLYGVFLARESELADMYRPGGVASRVFPEVFEQYLAILPPGKRGDPVAGYNMVFNGPRDAAIGALRMWTRLEKRATRLAVTEEYLDAVLSDPDYVLAHSLIENHYFMHNGFIDGDALLRHIGAKLDGVPLHIVQGRYDMVCPFRTAWELHKAVPHSVLHAVENGGHSAWEAAMAAKLVEVLDGLERQETER